MEKEPLYKIAFVNAYFGKLPKDLNAWLISCKFNPTIDWYIFTDDEQKRDVPLNVKIINMKFSEVRERMQKLFPFPISLERPYKLCDFKPCYGLAFADYLSEYDFWGHCDLDMVFGDIRAFLTSETLDKNERFGMQGQCTLYKNNEHMTTAFLNMKSQGCLDCKKVYSNPESFAFDEWAGHLGGGLSEIMKRNDVHYLEYDYSDLRDDTYGLYDCNSDKKVRKAYLFNNGKLTENYLDRKNKRIISREIQYVHFHQRKLKTEITMEADKFLIIQPGIVVGTQEDQFTYKELQKVNSRSMEQVIYWLEAKKRWFLSKLK